MVGYIYIYMHMYIRNCCCRYIARSGIAIVVRPMGTPEGVKVFKVEWFRDSKAINVVSAFSGELVIAMPGTWGPLCKFMKAHGNRAGFSSGFGAAVLFPA